jgi:hypothetical protein
MKRRPCLHCSEGSKSVDLKAMTGGRQYWDRRGPGIGGEDEIVRCPQM